MNSAKQIKNTPTVNRQLTVQELLEVVKTETTKLSELLSSLEVDDEEAKRIEMFVKESFCRMNSMEEWSEYEYEIV